jgi:hypothetical protein
MSETVHRPAEDDVLVIAWEGRRGLRMAELFGTGDS